MSVLGFVVVAASAVYVAPKVLGLTWTFGMTEVGRFVATWVITATLYDLLVNASETDAFTYGDAAGTFVLTLLVRMGLRRWRG